MKKTIIFGLIILAVLSLGIVSVASADDGGFSFMGRLRSGTMPLENGMHDWMIAELADAFGISPETLEERLAQGETLPAIAAEYGYEGESFYQLLQDIHQLVRENAQNSGEMFNYRYDFMHSRGTGISSHAMMFQNRSQYFDETNPMHEYMVAALAELTGLDQDEILSAHNDGIHLYELLDISMDDFHVLMSEAREIAFEQADLDGLQPEGIFGGAGLMPFGQANCFGEFEGFQEAPSELAPGFQMPGNMPHHGGRP